MVADVAPGTGMMVMATDQVELFKNAIKDNDTYSMLIVSFLITGRPMQDKQYDPFPEAVYVHDNTISGGGSKPKGERATMLTALLGAPLPDIIYDGILNPAKLVDGKLPPSQGIYVKNNGSATFANLHWDQLDEKASIASNKAKIDSDISKYQGELPALPEITLTETP